MDIEPSVRDRLVEMDSTRSEELDSAAQKALNGRNIPLTAHRLAGRG